MVYLGDSEQIWLCPGGSKGTQLTLAGRGPRRHDLALDGTEVPGSNSHLGRLEGMQSDSRGSG